MRIPFIKREIIVSQSRIDFIQNTRGGSPMVLAGGIYWAVSGCAALLMTPKESSLIFIYGGIIIPFLGFLLAKLLNVSLLQRSDYTSLTILSSTFVPFCLPILFLASRYNPSVVAPTLAVLNGAHFLIMMWIHLDYIFFLLADVQLIIGILFLFSFPSVAPVAVSFISALVTLFSGTVLYFTSTSPLQGYKVQIITETRTYAETPDM
ncbi:MAG: hypothetical protein OWS03_00020 [Alicyclobacillaceae bacterium]|nr:hypothetical protein [Alicyclobacillaceae bacterium]